MKKIYMYIQYYQRNQYFCKVNDNFFIIKNPTRSRKIFIFE